MDILDSIDLNCLVNFPSVSQRYYEHKYCMSLPNVENRIHQCISFHSNRICLISLAESHPARNKKISRVNYVISESINRLKNKTSGKGKRGAQKLVPASVICNIECDDQSVYPVYSCIHGKLIEVNRNLMERPELLNDEPQSEGYIALLLPILNLYDDCKKSMLVKDQYLELVNKN